MNMKRIFSVENLKDIYYRDREATEIENEDYVALAKKYVSPLCCWDGIVFYRGSVPGEEVNIYILNPTLPTVPFAEIMSLQESNSTYSIDTGGIQISENVIVIDRERCFMDWDTPGPTFEDIEQIFIKHFNDKGIYCKTPLSDMCIPIGIKDGVGNMVFNKDTVLVEDGSGAYKKVCKIGYCEESAAFDFVGNPSLYKQFRLSDVSAGDIDIYKIDGNEEVVSLGFDPQSTDLDILKDDRYRGLGAPLWMLWRRNHVVNQYFDEEVSIIVKHLVDKHDTNTFREFKRAFESELLDVVAFSKKTEGTNFKRHDLLDSFLLTVYLCWRGDINFKVEVYDT